MGQQHARRRFLPQPVLPDLFAAFQNPQSWSAALPPATTVAGYAGDAEAHDQTLCVHPMGTLQVKETVVPLDLPITKYGNATPSDGTEFSIQSVQINAQTETIQTIQDYFAPGQFLNLSDADKLSKPSFEEMDAGVNIGSSAILNGQDSPRTVVYQEFYIYDPANFSHSYGPVSDAGEYSSGAQRAGRRIRFAGEEYRAAESIVAGRRRPQSRWTSRNMW